MQVLTSPKERIYSLVNNMNDLQLLEVANYVQFIRQKEANDTLDLIRASESTLDFWDNEDDKGWDNV